VRVVMGRRDLPPTARVLSDEAPSLLLRTHDPRQALQALGDREMRHVYLEGGPTLAGAFVAAGLVDRVVAYTAGLLLGAGPSALAEAGVSTLDAAPRLRITDTTMLGDDVRVVAVRDARKD
jgi:diaminohydroxyphosphoribosylaminopyrimidine deaminase/5-amino-6-(5-phosphoribosylamino)uracil reductase